MRAYHDLGGLPGGPIDRTEHDAALWEKRVHAMLGLLAERQVISVDELRHGIETLGEAEYSRLTYYERWIESITRALVQRGVLTTDELGRIHPSDARRLNVRRMVNRRAPKARHSEPVVRSSLGMDDIWRT